MENQRDDEGRTMGKEQVNLPAGVETRAFAEFRVDGDDDDGATIEGHAATFNDPYPIADFEEQVAPGAFADSIKNDDVRALFNHDPNIVLGRQSSGTLRLAEDDVGLFSEIDLPKSAESIREGIGRGDIREMSFGFTVEAEKWEQRDDAPDLRTIERARLWDVSPVTFPANPNTDVALERYQEWRSQLETEPEDDADTEPDLRKLARQFKETQEKLARVLDALDNVDMDVDEELVADSEPDIEPEKAPVPRRVSAELELMEAELKLGRDAA